jgi:hypothetical protein
MTDPDTETRRRDALIDVNVGFSDRERFPRSDNKEWFTTHLAEDLVFRRASGAVTDRSGYLEGLMTAENTTDHIEAAITSVEIAGRHAAVEAVVALKGTRGGKVVDGQFHNRRMFVLDSGDRWRCVGWWNDAIPDRASHDGIDSVDRAVAHFCPDAPTNST